MPKDHQSAFPDERNGPLYLKHRSDHVSGNAACRAITPKLHRSDHGRAGAAQGAGAREPGIAQGQRDPEKGRTFWLYQGGPQQGLGALRCPRDHRALHRRTAHASLGLLEGRLGQKKKPFPILRSLCRSTVCNRLPRNICVLS